ncbi:MAG: magnesium and cobalt exporter, family [Pyrinomonadaceae bacterium]|jgi:putative hemolysin|nr:magnesium and cobalt exporter, family [Pyrinomonadaceae bacterium]MDQ1728933.1 magnesium and cobalt exporter, family [Pyrinomonadaceae bacterium]
MRIEFILAFLLLLGLSVLATVDMAFGQLSDVGLRRLITEAEERAKTRSAAFLKQVLENRPRFSFAISATIQILLVAVAVLVTSISLSLFQEDRFVLVGLLTGLVLAGVFRQLLPLFISTRDPEGTLLFLLPVIRPLLPLMAFAADPFHKLFDRSRRKVQETENDDEDDEQDAGDDIQALIDVGEAEGILEEEEGELIHSILEFGDTRVNEVMTPRPDIVAVSATANVTEARDVMIESKYSRLPVYRDQIDNVEGLIYVRDLLQQWAEGKPDGPISPLVRPVYFVPETKPVAELLEEMQKAHVQLSMVIDEYGGVSGLVTVEDILEEIVGEIEDEDIEGDELNEIVEQCEGCYEVSGATEIGKIERLFAMEIEADDFTTIAGLVINEAGKVPPTGAVLTFRGLEVKVLEADEKRIGRLRVQRAEVDPVAVSQASKGN